MNFSHFQQQHIYKQASSNSSRDLEVNFARADTNIKKLFNLILVELVDLGWYLWIFVDLG